jgi:Acetyltransferase (GNAT) family
MNIGNTELIIAGRFIRMAKLRDEGYDFLEDPPRFLEILRDSKIRADLFTFLQEPYDLEPRHALCMEPQKIPVLPITTYDDWFKKQINDKTRNMIRKAVKSGVEIRAVEYNDEFVRGVIEIFNESPIRQGRPFWHYGKDFDTVKRELGTFPDRSRFAGAFHNGELIGFIKLTTHKRQTWALLMQIVAKMAHRNKATNNALMAKAVQICAEMKISRLQYGTWSTGGLGDFKVKNGFICIDSPRYFAPLNTIGALALKLRLHRDPKRLIPRTWLDKAVALRGTWYVRRHEKTQRRNGQ